MYAHWINNPRIRVLFQLSPEENARLAHIRSLPEFAKVLFLGPPPSETLPQTQSVISTKMDRVFNMQMHSPAVIVEEPAVWNAKLQTFTTLAAQQQQQQLEVMQIFAVALYCNNVEVFDQLNKAVTSEDFTKPIIRERISLLLSAMNACQPFVGECFIGSCYIDRRSFLIGAEVTFSSFLSASAMWRVATANVPEFATKKREGVVFIVKSISGRLVSSYSAFQHDNEVIFRPYTRFKVTNWYHGDVIALGQANIRKHTFAIRADTIEFMMDSKKSLIIELQEIERTRELQIK